MKPVVALIPDRSYEKWTETDLLHSPPGLYVTTQEQFDAFVSLGYKTGQIQVREKFVNAVAVGEMVFYVEPI